MTFLDFLALSAFLDFWASSLDFVATSLKRMDEEEAESELGVEVTDLKVMPESESLADGFCFDFFSCIGWRFEDDSFALIGMIFRGTIVFAGPFGFDDDGFGKYAIGLTCDDFSSFSSFAVFSNSRFFGSFGCRFAGARFWLPLPAFFRAPAFALTAMIAERRLASNDDCASLYSEENSAPNPRRLDAASNTASRFAFSSSESRF